METAVFTSITTWTMASERLGTDVTVKKIIFKPSISARKYKSVLKKQNFIILIANKTNAFVKFLLNIRFYFESFMRKSNMLSCLLKCNLYRNFNKSLCVIRVF